MLVSLQAQEIYTTGNIPKVHLQDKTRYVCNPAGILSAPACDEIDRMLYALEQQTGIETVVAVVPSIGSEDCFPYADFYYYGEGVIYEFHLCRNGNELGN